MWIPLRSRVAQSSWQIVRSVTGLSGAEKSTSSTEVLSRPQNKARIYEDGEHSIDPSQISDSAWSVIWKLKKHGYEAFFVGGTVRDLCRNQTPKDIDIVTSAELHEVKRLFYRSTIVSKRFPICLLTKFKEHIEVSCITTGLDVTTKLPVDLEKTIHACRIFEKTVDDDEDGRLPITWSCLRYWNCITRDFSVNAMMYEPCTQLLFDYVGGYGDLNDKRLRCLKDPSLSFQEDPARILRAIRFAARLGFSIDDEMGEAMQKNAKLLETIPQSRLQFEFNTILSYGSGAEAFKLMWRWGVLDCLLPRHSSYLTVKNYPRDGSHESDYLFTILDAFDQARGKKKELDEGTCVVMVAAPLIAHDVQRLRKRIHDEENTGKSVDHELQVLRRQREDIAFKLLAQTVLNRMGQTTGGGMVFTHAAVRKALELFNGLKQRHIHEAHELKNTSPIKPSEEVVFRVLAHKHLKWKMRSNLGLAMADPTEQSVHRMSSPRQ